MSDKINAEERYQERAAILEYCANFSREDAERRARIESDEWLKSRRPDDEVQP